MDLISQEGQVGHQKGPFYPAAHRPGVMEHLFQRQGQGAGIPQVGHGQAVAHQDQVDPSLIQNLSGGVVGSREGHQRLTRLFGLAKVVNG